MSVYTRHRETILSAIRLDMDAQAKTSAIFFESEDL